MGEKNLQNKLKDAIRIKGLKQLLIPLSNGVKVNVVTRMPEQVNKGLHICPECKSKFVRPVDWHAADEEASSWWLMLECANCGYSSEGIYSCEQVEQLEDAVEDSERELQKDLGRLSTANLAGDVNRFIGALQVNAITPEDF